MENLMKITNENIEATYNQVMLDDIYGNEMRLVEECLKKYPENKDIDIVAMKIGLIDITNSTHISQHKSKISVYDLSKHIISIENIDERIKMGDPSVVNEIAKPNEKITLFSFASKYCCYHNYCIYKRDDYSIIDNIVKETLPKYFKDINKYKLQKWQKENNYIEFNDYITKKLDELGISTELRKRKFDFFLWYPNKKVSD